MNKDKVTIDGSIITELTHIKTGGQAPPSTPLDLHAVCHILASRMHAMAGLAIAQRADDTEFSTSDLLATEIHCLYCCLGVLTPQEGRQKNSNRLGQVLKDLKDEYHAFISNILADKISSERQGSGAYIAEVFSTIQLASKILDGYSEEE